MRLIDVHNHYYPDEFIQAVKANGRPIGRTELIKRMDTHIRTLMERYKGKIRIWDVVNEAISDGGDEVLRNSLWLQIIGPDFIAKAFEYAHEADPDAILRYNDYGLENPAKRQKLIKLIKSLQEQLASSQMLLAENNRTVKASTETIAENTLGAEGVAGLFNGGDVSV